jgi:coronin-1B/1C/6
LVWRYVLGWLCAFLYFFFSSQVRSSKFRHVFGQAAKTEECFSDIRLTRTAWDSNFISVNPEFWALLWDSGGGGSFAVKSHKDVGKIDPRSPLVSGHKSAVLDLDWNPFNDSLLASVSEDCYAKIWQIPEGGLKETMTESVQTLQGHRRKVGVVHWNPVAENIMMTASSDFSVKTWDVETGDCAYSLDGEHTDIIQSCDWNYNGSLLVSTCKDKKLRVIDPRSNKVAQEGAGHQGVKGSRAMWLGAHNKIFTVGFTKLSEREFAVWDPADLSKPLAKERLDSSSGVIMPFYDEGTNMVFLAGKGDGNVRYYEIVDDAKQIYSLSEFKTSDPQRGMDFMPKRGCDVSSNEVALAFKVTPKAVIPIHFTVPRKSDMFQDDIFPDAPNGEASLDAAAWKGGSNADPKTSSLEGGFVAPVKKEIKFEKKEEAKELTPTELKAKVEELNKRVAYLEAELVKKDAKIKEMEG